MESDAEAKEWGAWCASRNRRHAPQICADAENPKEWECKHGHLSDASTDAQDGDDMVYCRRTTGERAYADNQ